LENFGLPIGSTYGWEGATCRWGKRKPGTPVGVQSFGVVYQYGHQLDFSFMILEYYRYSGRDISEYLPFIESSVTFFDEHYRYRHKKRTGRELNENGKLVIFPSRACESYVDAKNPADVIAGLKAVLARLLELPDSIVDENKKIKFRNILDRVPDLPFREKDGVRCLAGAEEWSRFSVGEIPELYCVFPYGLYGTGKDGLETARYTWENCLLERQKNPKAPWYQGGIFAARLGYTAEARDTAALKLGDSNRRFPAFRDTDDWTPDHNWLGAGMKGLQEMLIQTAGQDIYILPAWPEEWDVDFKLHAPGNCVVEAKVRKGKVKDLKITPACREKDIKIPQVFE
jgi:hypothetical protein